MDTLAFLLVDNDPREGPIRVENGFYGAMSFFDREWGRG